MPPGTTWLSLGGFVPALAGLLAFALTCFVLETTRRYAEAGLDMAAYYHIRDGFVDPSNFDWMSPGGRRFMVPWWNAMPQYSALFDHHELDVRLEPVGVAGRNARIVRLDPAAAVNNLKVVHFGRAEDLDKVPLRLQPWDILWVEVE